MERESNPMEALCRSGCGFYGNPSTDGLCSVCFKEALKKKQQPPTSAPSPSATAFVTATAAAPLAAPASLATPLPTPLAAAVPTVPARPHPAPSDEKMDDDPNKKESKGKRVIRKAVRRRSEGVGAGRGGHGSSEDNPEHPSEEPPPPRDQQSSPHLTQQLETNEEPSPQDHSEPGPSTGPPQPDEPRKGLKRKAEDEGGPGASTSAGNSDNDADDKDKKKKVNRCAVCRKKVGLTGFECRCGGLFCAVHRYSDKHECSFDYRELGAQEIRRNNPVVVSQKIDKI